MRSVFITLCSYFVWWTILWEKLKHFDLVCMHVCMYVMYSRDYIGQMQVKIKFAQQLFVQTFNYT
jgi:hypothetical protein